MWFLGMDVGTGGTRAVVVDAAGKLISGASSDHAPFRTPHPGWAEQDPEDWWRAAQDAIRFALAAAPEPHEPIAAIGLTGQMHGAVMLDENGAGAAAVADLVRHANAAGVRLADRKDRLRKADRADLQSGAAEFHADKAAVGEDARAGDLREDAAHHVSEGLCALSADGRVCHRRAGGVGNAAAGCDAPALVEGSGRGGRDSGELAAEAV